MGKLQTKKMKKARFKRRFLTKSQARRMLQVDHKQFKRLCILKGIYPRQPPQFRHSMGKDKIYYITKDIRYIVTDPILEKIREYDACTKKIHSLASQRKKAEVAKLAKRRPSFLPLDETIRERYPTFTDALRDLSDALSMVALYSLIPARVESHTTIEGHRYHTTGLYEQCVEIMKRWKAVVESRVGCLQKGFLSIKGFYFQARIEDEEPMWLVPHEFAHKFPKSVEHSVMMSFLEFYVTFLNFVLFKLEHDAREAARNDASEECGDASIPQDESEHPQENANSKKIGAAHSDLPFQRLVFFTSREAAPEHVNFVVRCLGGVVAYTPDVADLTHIVMDRPTLPPGQARRLGVEYVQPQYVFDCLNARVLLPVDGYLMGEKCPPHVSPFVISVRNDPNEFSLEQRVEHRNAYSSHVPDRIHEIRRAIDPTYEKDSKDVVGGDVDDMSSLDSEDYDELYAGTEKDVHLLDSKLVVDDDDDDGDGDDDDDDPSSESGEGEDDDDEGLDVPLEHSRSMESAKAVEKIRVKNLANTPTAPRIVDAKRAVVRDHYTQRVQASTEERTRMKKKLKQKREEERKEAAKVLLSKKVRGVYVATSISQKRQQRKAEHLDTTRREIQKGTLKVNPKHGYLEKST